MANNRTLKPKPKPAAKPRKQTPAKPPLKDGRPTKRTPEARERILTAVRLGVSFEIAAKAAGVSEDLVREWRRTDSTFYEDCEKARAQFEVDGLALIQAQAMKGNWQAKAWAMERIIPERYGRRFQPVAMIAEQADADAPGKVYRVAIEPMPNGEAA